MKLLTVNNIEFEIDRIDLEKVLRFKWYAVKGRSSGVARRINTHYIICSKPLMHLHRFITGAPKGLHVDHIDKNGTNNKRSNLRFATPSQNAVNMRQRVGISGYRGVYLNKNKKAWDCCVQFEGKRYRKLNFKRAEDAAREYDRIAKNIHGEFAVLNFQGKDSA